MNNKLEEIDLGKYGIMISSARINDKYRNHTWQPDLTKLLQSDKYKTFIDIGGGNGYFSIIAAKHCNQVEVYEASPLLFGEILYNIRFLLNIKAYYEFVGNKESIPKTNKNTKVMITVDMEFPYNIKVKPLQDILNEKYPTPILVKIDIEGGEVEALKGATSEQLQDERIHWFIDVHKRHNVFNKDILVFFKGRQYKLHRHGVLVQ